MPPPNGVGVTDLTVTVVDPDFASADVRDDRPCPVDCLLLRIEMRTGAPGGGCWDRARGAVRADACVVSTNRITDIIYVIGCRWG